MEDNVINILLTTMSCCCRPDPLARGSAEGHPPEGWRTVQGTVGVHQEQPNSRYAAGESKSFILSKFNVLFFFFYGYEVVTIRYLKKIHCDRSF